MNFILLPAFFLLLIGGCRDSGKQAAPVPSPQPLPKTAVQRAPSLPGCTGCHHDVRLDERHQLACTACHQGDNSSADKSTSHQGMIASPADPANMAARCGSCHAEQVASCAQSAHFTLKKEINLIRGHFNLEPVNKLTEIPDRRSPPQNTGQLVDDLLRRHCLRCHVHAKGDSYAAVRRGTGCAACHLRYADGKLQSHAFAAPGERQCLSCHYGNHVGSDFLGRYEHDYSQEFRTPYMMAGESSARPYGVEQHDLAQDIHRQRGLTCLDCHSGKELSGRQAAIKCADCHAPAPGKVPPLKNVRAEGGQLLLTAVQDGKQLPIPGLRHPAHARYKNKVDCQVCHAQWSFGDQPTHLLLSYAADAEPWRYLTVQSSSATETFLFNNLHGDERKASMPDAITGQAKPGIWLQGYSLRRWENLLIRRDSDGIIKVFRPILDLRLSAADSNGNMLAGLDNVAGSNSGLLPYTPHSTGPAGLFYEQRFLHLLEPQDAPSPLNNQNKGPTR